MLVAYTFSDVQPTRPLHMVRKCDVDVGFSTKCVVSNHLTGNTTVYELVLYLIISLTHSYTIPLIN